MLLAWYVPCRMMSGKRIPMISSMTVAADLDSVFAVGWAGHGTMPVSVCQQGKSLADAHGGMRGDPVHGMAGQHGCSTGPGASISGTRPPALPVLLVLLCTPADRCHAGFQ
jgi:hypothetical protein